VSGLQGIRGRVSCGTEILIDGGAGEVVIWPSDETLAEARPKTHRELRVPLAVPAVPGFRVLANIGTAADVRLALDVDAEGIGLYRTEVEVIEAGLLLNEDALAERYTAVVRSMEGRQVVFRMFDVGSDKPLPTVEMPKEDNPALGCRGARFLLARSDLMRSQARALARASVHGKVHVMYPMVVNPEQFLKLRDMFADATADLLTGEILHGAMLEVPSACLQTAEILADADFASVGTNDLLQYLFAADRNNALVATDAERNHHTLWTLLRSVVEAARSAGKPVSVCGEIAADPSFIPRLIDLGFTCVSVSPRQLGNIRLAARAHLSRPAPPPSPALEA